MKTYADLHGNMQMQGIKSLCGNNVEVKKAALSVVSDAIGVSGGSVMTDALRDSFTKSCSFNLADVLDTGELFAPLRSNPHRSPG